MNRRQFTRSAWMCAAAAFGMGGVSSAHADSRPQVAVTMDDFILFDTPQLTAGARNQAILDALQKYSSLKAALFVTAKFVAGEENMRMLRMWGERGHTIANHTYSHWEYPAVDFAKFAEDVTRAETVLSEVRGYRKLFRFPYLKEGRTAEQRDKMRAFLKARGYRQGYVTIDASDWYVDQRLRERLKQNPRADVRPYRDFYLSHIMERSNYYEALGRKVLGRGVKHTLLIHHNVLNGLFLDDLLRMFRRRGWRLIDAEEAFTDPVFTAAPNIAPAGESIIWALARETGRFDRLLRYPAEDGAYEKARMDALGL